MPWPTKFYWIKRNVKNDAAMDKAMQDYLDKIDKGTEQPSTLGEEKRALQGLSEVSVKPKPPLLPKPRR
jgi:hypothetical protein